MSKSEEATWGPGASGYKSNEDGVVLCPMQKLQLDYPDPDGEGVYVLVPCGEQLNVRWTGATALTDWAGPYEPGHFDWGRWRVECDEGHVIATAYNDGDLSDAFQPDRDLPATADIDEQADTIRRLSAERDEYESNWLDAERRLNLAPLEEET